MLWLCGFVNVCVGKLYTLHWSLVGSFVHSFIRWFAQFIKLESNIHTRCRRRCCRQKKRKKTLLWIKNMKFEPNRSKTICKSLPCLSANESFWPLLFIILYLLWLFAFNHSFAHLAQNMYALVFRVPRVYLYRYFENNLAEIFLFLHATHGANEANSFQQTFQRISIGFYYLFLLLCFTFRHIIQIIYMIE